MDQLFCRGSKQGYSARRGMIFFFLSEVPVILSVPQNSVLGPLPFLLYISDLPDNI